MKKRIEEDGVVYTIDATSGNCIDIDVKPKLRSFIWS